MEGPAPASQPASSSLPPTPNRVERAERLALRRRIVVGVLSIGCLTLGAALIEPAASSARNAAPKAEVIRRPLGELVGRQHRLKVTLGPLGPTFTLTNLGGHPIDSDTSLEALAARHPELPIGQQARGDALMFGDDRAADMQDAWR